MGRTEFVEQLKALGYSTQELPHEMIGIKYIVPIGKNSGRSVELALQPPGDFPMNCPPGPHFKSTEISGWIEPNRNIHASPLGSGWRYWSRPFPDWNRTQKTVKSYFAHLKNLLANL